MRLNPPLVYQDTPEGRRKLDGRYRLLDGGGVAFSVDGYNKNLPLVIDPLISFSTYLGGASTDYGYDVALDDSGNVYVAGTTYSSDFPVSSGAYDSTILTKSDIFISKLTADGSSLVFSTFLGGDDYEYEPRLGLAADGSIVIAGSTYSANFPTTEGAYREESMAGKTVFVTRLLSDGSDLVYSTRIGFGTLTDVALDAAGNSYVLASVSSTAFPTTANAYQETYQGGYDLTVSKLSADGSSLVYSTFIGGTGNDYGRAITVAGTDQAIVVGYSYSSDYPMVGALQATLGGTSSYADGIVTRLDSDGESLIYSTYLGGEYFDKITDVSVDHLGAVYVVGTTESNAFPTTIGAFRTTRPSSESGFISVLNAAGSSLNYSTYCWREDDEPRIALNSLGEVHIGGLVYSNSYSIYLPGSPYAFQPVGGGYYDAYVAKFSADLSVLLHVSYLGGSGYDYLKGLAVDTADNLYAVGYTESRDFPTTSGAFQTSSTSTDAFVTKIAPATISCTYNLTPGSFDLGFEEQTINLGITTTVGCVWLLNGSTSWLTADHKAGVGSDTVTLDVSENHNVSSRSSTLTVDGESRPVHQNGEPCSYTLIPQSRAFGAAGGTSTVSVIAPYGCYWKPSSAAAWITFTSNGYRYQDGVVEFSVAANAGAPRGASIAIANAALTVTQSGTGSTGSPPAAPAYTAPANGATNVVQTPILSWQPVAGATSRSVYVGQDDIGHLELAASNVTGTSAPAGSLYANRPHFWKVVAQNAYGDSGATSPVWSFVTTSCSTSLTLGKTGFSMSGGTGSVTVAATGCPWNAYSDADWVTITSGATGTGNGTVNFSVASYYGGASARVATLMVGGREVTVAQAGQEDPIITTVAGSGISGCCLDGGLATAARLSSPDDVAVDSQGNLYIADTSNNRIRKVNASTGVITTIAGTGTSGFSGDLGPATAAKLNHPSGVAVDSAGNVYIADGDNRRIRKVTVSTGIITTVAGNGTAAYSGDGGQATAASLSGPSGLTFDGSGNLLIADTNNHAIRRVSAATGVITTVAGTGVGGYYGDGGLAIAARLYYPYGVAVAPDGDILIADRDNRRVRRVDAATGIITTVAGDGDYSSNGDGGLATSAGIYYPNGVVVDQVGNLFISDDYGNRVRKVDVSSGIITSVVGTGEDGYTGDGGPAAYAKLQQPGGLAYDPVKRDLFIVDWTTPVVRKVAGIGEDPNSIPAPQYLYPANGATNVPPMAIYQWNAVPGATSYDLYVGANSPTQLSLRSANIQSLFWSGGTLSNGTKYYWKVVAKNASGSSAATSPVWSFTVRACSYTLDSTNAEFTAAGGLGSVSVTTDPACTWMATSTQDWVTITSGQLALGTGTARYTVAENTVSRDRSTSLTIAHQSYSVNQAGKHQSGRVGLADDGMWYLDTGDRSWNIASDSAFQYGPLNAGWTSLIGDWDGDGIATPGLYVPSAGIWLLKNSAGPGNADTVFQYGPGGLGWLPVVGDWDGDGVDTPGLYAPDSGFWFLKNSLGPGNADEMFGYGPGALGWLPIVGDWNGDGVDTPGLYVPDSGSWFLKNSLGPGAADEMFGYGPGGLGWLPFSGDWDDDGTDTIGLYNPNSGYWFLRDQLAGGNADSVFYFRPSGSGGSPITGRW